MSLPPSPPQPPLSPWQQWLKLIAIKSGTAPSWLNIYAETFFEIVETHGRHANLVGLDQRTTLVAIATDNFDVFVYRQDPSNGVFQAWGSGGTSPQPPIRFLLFADPHQVTPQRIALSGVIKKQGSNAIDWYFPPSLN